MRILLIGPTDSIWMKSYIENVLLNNDHDIYVIGKLETRFRNFYLENNIHIIRTDRFGSGIIRKISSYFFPIISVMKEMKFDVLHVQYANHYSLIIASILSGFVQKTIVSYWGSDLFRTSKKELSKWSKYLDKADVITVCTKSMNDYFRSQYGTVYDGKTQIIDYGANGFPAIDKALNLDTNDNVFNFPQEKIVIMVGYNGSEGQQHLSVIEALSSIPEELQKKLFVVFPMTYATNEEYKNKVKNKIKANGKFEYRVLEDFLTSELMAQLYINCDWMIHAQITDALSASVQEFLYAGKLLFNPQWLNYEEIDNKDVYYVKYKDFSELIGLVSKYITHGISSEEEEQLSNNRKILYGYSSWDVLRNRWRALY